MITFIFLRSWFTASIVVFIILSCLFPTTNSTSALFGFVGKDHVVMSSTSRYMTGCNIKDGHQWIHRLGKDILIGYIGDPADCDILHQALWKYCRLQELKFGTSCKRDDTRTISFDPYSIAHYARFLMATKQVKLHKGALFMVGGFTTTPPITDANSPSETSENDVDLKSKPIRRPVLYYLDRLDIFEMPYAGHALGGAELVQIFSAFDRFNHETDEDKEGSKPHLPSEAVDSSHNESTGDKASETLAESKSTKVEFLPESLLARKKSHRLQKLSIDESKKVIDDMWKLLQKRSMSSLTASIQTEFLTDPEA